MSGSSQSNNTPSEQQRRAWTAQAMEIAERHIRDGNSADQLCQHIRQLPGVTLAQADYMLRVATGHLHHYTYHKCLGKALGERFTQNQDPDARAAALRAMNLVAAQTQGILPFYRNLYLETATAFINRHFDHLQARLQWQEQGKRLALAWAEGTNRLNRLERRREMQIAATNPFVPVPYRATYQQAALAAFDAAVQSRRR